MNHVTKAVITLLFVTAGLISLCWSGSGPTASAQTQEKTTEQVYKNIKVLGGLPAHQLLGAMNFMAGALGTSCNHCHVPNQFANDDKPAKEKARQHIRMVRALNDANFDGKSVVNCATCHRAETNPNAVVTFAVIGPSQPASGSTLPSTNDILERYIRAIGGEKKIDALKTLTIEGSREMRNGDDPPVNETLLVLRKAPNMLLMTFTPADNKNQSTQAFDGTAAWRKFGERVSRVSAADTVGAKRDADIYKDIRLGNQYTSMSVLGIVRIGERQAYVLEDRLPADHPAMTMFGVDRELLFFDIATGLLVRRSMDYVTPFGKLNETTDYTDYRKVGGMMFPFVVRLARPPLVVTQTFAKIKVNAPIEDTRFQIPATK